MEFRQPFPYRTLAEINAHYPDLRVGSKWSLDKICRVKRTHLLMLGDVKVRFGVRMDTVWMAQFYFQRYYTQNAFQHNTPFVFMAACIHLACKVTDLPRKLDEVITKAHHMRFGNDNSEREKINDPMYFIEVKERVLMAERALLYCFSFDFRTGDPYSYALNYNGKYGHLTEQQTQRALSWLNLAAQATTLCLQFPPHIVGVVSLWYAQHLVHGKISTDEQSNEWWETLPVEKQDGFCLAQPTAEDIEKAHWQLAPQMRLDYQRAQTEEGGLLPGDGCKCKVCRLHHDLQLRAAAQQAEAEAKARGSPNQGQASPQAASDTSVQTAAGSLPASLSDVPTDAVGLSSALLEHHQQTVASVPGTASVGAAATAGPEATPADGNTVTAGPGAHRKASAPADSALADPAECPPADLHHPSGAHGYSSSQPAVHKHGVAAIKYGEGQSRYSPRGSPSWHSHNPGNDRSRPSSRPSSTQPERSYRNSPSGRRSDPFSAAVSSTSHEQYPNQHMAVHHAEPGAGAGRLASEHKPIYSPVLDHSTFHQPASGARPQQLSRPSGDAKAPAAADYDSEPEEGEIEDGEVLPDADDGAVAAGHPGDVAKKRKQSASPGLDVDAARFQNTDSPSRGSKRFCSPRQHDSSANDVHAHCR